MANYITMSRIVLSLILLGLTPFSTLFRIVYILCGLTDILDGYIARKTKTSTEFGAKLDSIADVIFIAVCFIRLVPAIHFPKWGWLWAIAIAGIKGVSILAGYLMKKELVMLHTKANKLMGFCLWVFPLVITFIPLEIALLPVGTLATFAAIQEVYLVVTESLAHSKGEESKK